MILKVWNLKLLAAIAPVAGLAVVATRSGSAQEADVLIEAPVPARVQPQIEALDVIKLKADAVKMATNGVQRKIIALHGGPPDKMHAIREAATALNEAEGDDARSDAKAKMTELLDEFFESDMDRREKELAEVEERVTKLRSTLQRRREKKRDILDLQMEVLLNEADGLGFFGGEGLGGPGGPWRSSFKVPWESRKLYRSRRRRPSPLSHPRSRNRPLVDLDEVVAGLDEEVLVGGTGAAAVVVASAEAEVLAGAATKMPGREKLKNEDATANEIATENERRKAKKPLAKFATILFPPASPGPVCSPNQPRDRAFLCAQSCIAPDATTWRGDRWFTDGRLRVGITQASSKSP